MTRVSAKLCGGAKQDRARAPANSLTPPHPPAPPTTTTTTTPGASLLTISTSPGVV